MKDKFKIRKLSQLLVLTEKSAKFNVILIFLVTCEIVYKFLLS